MTAPTLDTRYRMQPGERRALKNKAHRTARRMRDEQVRQALDELAELRLEGLALEGVDTVEYMDEVTA